MLKGVKKYRIETILLDYLNHYHPEFIEKYYNIILGNGNDMTYLSYILEILGINSTLNIYRRSNFFYENVKYDTIKKKYYADGNHSNTPDILLFELDYSYIKNRNLKFNDGIGEEIIKFNGFQYKLDCILLCDKNYTHAITGLTCNGSKYVYNGWWEETKNPCNLMPFDWTTDTTNFCLNTEECSLPKDLFEGELCYNFKDNYKIMVYVKIKNDVELEIKQIKKINRVKISSYIDNLDIKTIKKLLKTKYNDKFIENESDKNLRRLFRYFLYKEYKISSNSPEESLSIINDTTSLEHI
jgi:hypothetical protein